ncbi:hypothetical protein [Nitrospina gracilis]|uniref:hypothetical protein n=1 Tax=Nitrospina gracilis TaxID=35801 RepID=UPI001F26ECD6|nr:hypothetical protein [Nitrospina gracilis]MCF8719208.1 hypothetical protein [Nitrospina gracilis Nb-211]
MIGFYYPTKASPTNTWEPSVDPVWPDSQPADYPHNLASETAGGTLYVQKLGVKRRRFLLSFELMPTADVTTAEAFFDAVQKQGEKFEYDDGQGGLHTVRWMSGFDFPKNRPGLHSGGIELRKE